jgi:hypothetical protein
MRYVGRADQTAWPTISVLSAFLGVDLWLTDLVFLLDIIVAACLQSSKLGKKSIDTTAGIF